MSKGPGKQQAGILHALEDKNSWTSEGLRWALFERSGGELTSDGRLPPTWNTSFSRAVEKLGEVGRIHITSRPLESFEECVEHYPGKTLKANARRLRLVCLPVLLAWTREKGGAGPRYGEAENEEHYMRSLPQEQIRCLEACWSLLEERLRPIYGNAQERDAPNLLRLICKGRSLFVSRDVSAAGSLATWIEASCAGSELPGILVSNLRDFMESFVPRSAAASLRFKSIIHLMADVPRLGQCTLRPETLEYLHTHCQTLVESMEGFAPKKGRFPTRYNPDPVEFDYDPKLTHLFDHFAFQAFDFLSLK